MAYTYTVMVTHHGGIIVQNASLMTLKNGVQFIRPSSDVRFMPQLPWFKVFGIENKKIFMFLWFLLHQYAQSEIIFLMIKHNSS